MRYEFTFAIEGSGPDDTESVVALTEHFDAMLARAAGVDLLTIASDGSDAIDAARTAVISTRFYVPQIEFLYLDRDLVGITEIAQRTGRSRQNVTQWVTGARHSDAVEPFPKVEGVVGRARVWLWAEVNLWLRQLDLGDDIAGPNRAEITDIDYMLRHDRLRTLQRPAAGLVWPAPHVLFEQSMRTTVAIHGALQASGFWILHPATPTAVNIVLEPKARPGGVSTPFSLWM